MPIVSIPGFADPFSSLSHLIGAGIFLFLSFFLIRRGRGDRARVASLVIFSFGAVLLLSISGVYHLLQPSGAAREVLRRLDHAAIFILIACSFTPPHVILFCGPGRWAMLLLIWMFAVVAISLKLVFFSYLPPVVGTGLYLAMGWLGLVSGISLAKRHGFNLAAPLLWGGVAYSIGAVFDVLRWPVLWPGVVQSHEVFHIAVLAGLAFHWAFIYGIADGRLTPIREPIEAASPEACSAPSPGR
jgi:channel protein (hemolysin III family)